MRIAATLVYLLLLATPALGADKTDEAARWVEKQFSDDATTLPFSFKFGSRPAAEFLGTWKAETETRKLDRNRTQHTVTRKDPGTGVEVRCRVVQYRDYPAVEWVLHFKNAGTRDTPILSEVQALDHAFAARATGDFTLHHSEGSHGKVTDFRPLEESLPPKAEFRLAPYGGRSSDGYLPFFNIARPGQDGVVLAIGWSGQWAASFTRDATPDSALQVRAGMERTHLKLHPGEEIRTPSVLILFWSGKDRLAGQNLLRRFLIDHASPRPGGKRVQPPVAISPHGVLALDGGTTEANVTAFIEATGKHKLPVDCFWFDAGWYESHPSGRWVHTGTWKPDGKRFPRGLKSVSETAHKHGFKFLLWFEPERAMVHSWLHKTHPEWLLAGGGFPPEQQYQANDGFYLLDLGNREALQWAKDTFSDLITSQGVDIFRNDFNMHPLHHWRNGEAADRHGMREIRYITGLYEFWDSLLEKHPHLLIDNCASGGRRIDLELLRRSIVLWRSDECWKPVPEQAMHYGLSLWIPYHGLGSVSLNPYDFRSGMGTSFSTVINSDQSTVERATGLLKEYLAVKPLFEGDFYPLTPYSLEENTWIAWQYDRPDLQKGVVQAFRRRRSSQQVHRFPLHGLDSVATYQFSDLDSGRSTILRGRQLVGSGLRVQLESGSTSALISYRKVGR